jgi:hypothetical protein
MDVGTLTATLALNDAGFNATIQAATAGLNQTTQAATGAGVAIDSAMVGAARTAQVANAQIQNVAASTDKMAASSNRASAGARNLFHQLKDMVAGLAQGMDPMMVLTQQGPQIADAFEMGGGAAETLGAAVSGLVGPFGFVAAALGETAVAAVAVYGAYESLNESAELQNKIVTEQSAAFERLNPILMDTQATEIDLAVATGDISKAMGDLEKASIKAFGEYNKATAETKQQLSDLNAKQNSVTTQLVDAAEYMAPAWTPLGAAIRGLTSDTADYQKQIDGAQASMDAATAALAKNHDEHVDLALALQGEKDAHEAATAAAKHHSTASDDAAKKAREEATAVREAAAALRAYVALYEEAGSAVYASHKNPAADFQKNFMAGVQEMLPKVEFTVSDKLDMAQASLADALSQGTIDQELYNQDLVTIAAARTKAEQDVIDAQREAARKVAGGIAEQGMNIVSSMGKFGQLVDAASQGAKAGGGIGAIVAVIGKLLSMNGKFQKSIEQLDKVIDGVVGALDGLVEGLNPLLGAVGHIISVVVGSLAPLFTIAGNILTMLSPILQVVATALTALSGAFQIMASTLDILSPILYAAFFLIYNVLKYVSVVCLDIAIGIETVWNTVVEAIASVLDSIGAKKAATQMRGHEADVGKQEAQRDALLSTSYADSINQATQSTNGFHAAVSDATDATNALTQSLSNVPTGFKLAKYVYDAATAQSGASGAGGGGGAAGGSGYQGGAGSGAFGVSIQIENMHVDGGDPDKILPIFLGKAKKAAVARRYSTVLAPSPWGTL